jgi:hypothetical protein
MRPAGMRPAGMRPAGMRPAGMRPAGMRPAGMRPAGMRPAGMRPAGMRDDDDMRDGLDPDEWSADIAELFCSYSAVIRSGARLVLGESDLIVPSESLQGVPDYLPPPVETEPDGAPPAALGVARRMLGVAAAASSTSLTIRRLHPRDNELTLTLEVRDQLVRALVAHPEIAWALKEDIARALAQRADQLFLQRITVTERTPGPTLLETTRDMVATLRDETRVHFANAGWILDATTLAALTTVLTRNTLRSNSNGATLDSMASGQLLAYDGADGGVLLGYPFILSAAAGGRIYFSADWSEAWIGADPALVSIQFSADTRFDRDEIVLRAVAHHDLLIRRAWFFTRSTR